MKTRPVLLLLTSLTLADAASAEKWLKIDPNDPFAGDGVFHHFDVDSGMEDRTTGFVAADMIYVKPVEAVPGVVTSRHRWAFDCDGNKVYYVAVSSQADGTKVTADWRQKANALDEPVMGGVTNMFGKKLCALKGSWPKGDLPK